MIENIKKIVFVFTLFSSVCLFGQLNPNTLLPNVMPSNPQATEFIKYGEIPVNKYTGVPDISVPVYTLETKSLNIPIALTYHSNGIKVNEEASWVGLGWNLSTDMEIVQAVVGLDDFGYYTNRTQLDYNCMIGIQGGGLSGTTAMSSCSTIFLGYDDNWNALHPDCFVNPMYAESLKDTEPDIFYFNAVGYSGKFLMNWSTGQFVCISDKNVKIESDIDGTNSTNLPTSFSITFPDGHRFQFTLKESTTINFSDTKASEGGSIPSNVSTIGEKSSRVYKLTKIMTTTADVIDFTYENSQVSKNFPYINLIARNYIPTEGVGSNFIPSTGGHLISYTATEQTYSYLKSINCNGENIEFFTSLREDLKEGKKLDKIIVTFKGKTKTFEFNYDYFVANTTGNNWDSYLNYGAVNPYQCNKTTDEINKRLKLTSFNELNHKPHVFYYDSQLLPKKTSYATDFWGFYNGVEANNSFFPNVYRFNIERGNENFYNFQENNNSPVLQYCKAATLEKITYPTGGSSIFEYELNTFDNYKVPPFNQGATVNLNLTTVPSSTSITQKALLIEGGNTIFNVSGLLSTQGCYPSYPEAHSSCNFKIVHFKKELIDYIRGNTTLNSHLLNYGLMYVLGADLDFLDGNPSNLTMYNQYKDMSDYIGKTINVFEDEFITNRKFNLAEGIVVFTVSGGCGVYSPTVNNNWSQSSFSINYRDYQPIPAGNSLGAGLRIKAIKSYTEINPGVTPTAIKKVYEYEGGKLMSPLLYFNKTQVSFTDHNLVSISVPGNGTCEAFLNSQLSSLLTQREQAWKKFFINPNKETAKKVKEISASINEVASQNCNSEKIYNYITNFFNGAKNEIHSASYIQPSTSASGKYVGYNKVTERYVDGNSTTVQGIGKEVNYYTNNPDIGSPPVATGGGFYTEINVPLMQNYPENGRLLKQELFSEANVLKRESINSYSFVQDNCYWGMKSLATKVFEVFDSGFGYQKKTEYLIGVYPIKSGKTVLSSSEEKNYEDASMISILKNYYYDTKNQVSKISSVDSSGDFVEKSFDYPYTLGLSEFSGMVTRNILTPVVESRTKINSVNNSLEQTKYKWISTPNTNNYFQSMYALDKVKHSKSGDYVDLKDVAVFHNYDVYSNIAEVSKKDGTRVSYIWGYNGKYPIAKIENASQATTENATLGYTIISQVLKNAAVEKSNTGTEAELITALNDIRNSLPDAMVTTYTYIPLIGISSITDPKGDKVTYHYDTTLNYLQYVKDKAGNIIQESNIHFKP